MKKSLLISITFCLALVTYGQKTEEILAEGRLLYRLEKASWNGTDDFLARFPEKRNLTGGFLSYESDNHTITNIFFSRENNDRILVRYQFDSIPGFPTHIDTTNVIATAHEKELIELRQDAIERISNDSENFFTAYENTAFNLIPLITKKERKVFVLTGPQVSNVVIIGNDYLLTYDKNNKLTKKEPIHKSLLQYTCKSDDPDKKAESTMHSHILSDCISSTDICTLLLYKDYVEWKTHYVFSKKYVSIFDLKNESLFIMKSKDFNKIVKTKKTKNN
jgi:hypothetical protein